MKRKTKKERKEKTDDILLVLSSFSFFVNLLNVLICNARCDPTLHTHVLQSNASTCPCSLSHSVSNQPTGHMCNSHYHLYGCHLGTHSHTETHHRSNQYYLSSTSLNRRRDAKNRRNGHFDSPIKRMGKVWALNISRIVCAVCLQTAILSNYSICLFISSICSVRTSLSARHTNKFPFCVCANRQDTQPERNQVSMYTVHTRRTHSEEAREKERDLLFSLFSPFRSRFNNRINRTSNGN